MENINLPNELLRLEIKQLAEEVRIKFAKKALADVFDILSETAFLIRKPLDIRGFSGFITYYEDRFVVYLNSNFTLGHERYTAAHELYHIIYNQDILKKEKVFLDKYKYKEEDKRADIFAAEFLMPEDYVKEVFYRLINVDRNKIQAKHVVRMHNSFRVSYRAMLKRLLQLNLCSIKKYHELIEISTLENKARLQKLTREEGFDIDLILPSRVHYIPDEYMVYIKSNFENGKTSEEELEEILSFIDLSPQKFDMKTSM